MRRRRTIIKPVVFEGFGIHSGNRSSVKILPLAEGSGINFAFAEGVYSIREARVAKSIRSTAVIFPGGQRLATVEHLLAALVGLGIDDALIEAADGSEFPILDGSALPFVQGLTEAGVLEKYAPADSRGLSAPLCVGRSASSIVAAPSEHLRITYVIDYPGTAIGTQIKDVDLTPESFASEVAPARTFALLSEVEALRKEGLAGGGGLENTLVFGDSGPLNEVAKRVESECAAHKILDLLGDLALTGTPATAHYICIRGGHGLHLRLAARLKSLFS
jgi:UDP-3-O-[3-hydroxymyristoyl] N-acetylglucosamine deacetylase